MKKKAISNNYDFPEPLILGVGSFSNSGKSGTTKIDQIGFVRRKPKSEPKKHPTPRKRK